MYFATILTLLPLVLASPLVPRQSGNTRITSAYLNKLYEWRPDMPYSDGWGEVSAVPTSKAPNKVHSLIAYKLEPSDFGKTCNLRFDKPSISTGGLTFSIYDFKPTSGKTYDPKKACWNNKTGTRGQKFVTYKAGGKSNLAYSMPCPKDWINLELAPEGDVNMQWPQFDPIGLWLEVVQTSKPASAPAPAPKTIRIDTADQVQTREASGENGHGSMQFGEITRAAPGQTVTTLIAFVMPKEDYTKRKCVIMFGKASEATGSKTFLLYDFEPENGTNIFQSWRMSWKFKRGTRKGLRATHTVGSNKVTEFPCPKPGKGLNYELAPTAEKVSIKWNSTKDKEGLWMEVV
ncbi:Protein of unknown function [Pyronema omphalodes CBS 100304]|uniref:Ubiquitin 3 binding protein But2 C-terminal domain-containing protein n=1 Tax=Pyronema omphalodes (strain CBS 100304) TaxID=1076935 RepID=U4L3D3_PYROM|nr:Protein of unknown function [Pyronema omphalodes CBS 100304]